MRAILIKMGILVIALAMVVGVATAAPAEVRITPESATIPYEDAYFRYDIDVYAIFEPGLERVISPTVPAFGPDGSADDLRFRFTNIGTGAVSSPEWLSNGQTWNWGKPTGSYDGEYLGEPHTYGFENLTMDVKANSTAPENVQYVIVVTDICVDPNVWDQATGWTTGTSVPEFATIAIPVAAILGLLFFFNHRKRRKE